MSLSGHKDTDMLILLQLEDRELGPVCQANSYIRNICKDENFWKMRVVNKIKKSYEGNPKYVNRPHYGKVIQASEVEDLKKYFGFSSMKELNDYLNKIPLNALYFLYVAFTIPDYADRQIIFDDKWLPKYMNKEEIIYFDRRGIWREFLKKDKNRQIRYPELFIKDNVPGISSKSNVPLSQQVLSIGDALLAELQAVGIKE